MARSIHIRALTRLSSPLALGKGEATRTELNLDRPLYVRGDALGNLVSLSMVIGLSALLVPLFYAATILVIDFYLLSRLDEMALM